MTDTLALLYVDDDADIRTIVQMALDLDPAMTVRTAPSGAAALAMIAESDWRPDVIVLDVMMPGMTGPETLAALRRRSGLAMTPALFMTARGRDGDMARYQDEGALGIVLKPFDPLRLAAEIRGLLERV